MFKSFLFNAQYYSILCDTSMTIINYDLYQINILLQTYKKICNDVICKTRNNSIAYRYDEMSKTINLSILQRIISFCIITISLSSL